MKKRFIVLTLVLSLILTNISLSFISVSAEEVSANYQKLLDLIEQGEIIKTEGNSSTSFYSWRNDLMIFNWANPTNRYFSEIKEFVDSPNSNSSGVSQILTYLYGIKSDLPKTNTLLNERLIYVFLQRDFENFEVDYIQEYSDKSIEYRLADDTEKAKTKENILNEFSNDEMEKLHTYLYDTYRGKDIFVNTYESIDKMFSNILTATLDDWYKTIDSPKEKIELYYRLYWCTNEVLGYTRPTDTSVTNNTDAVLYQEIENMIAEGTEIYRYGNISTDVSNWRTKVQGWITLYPYSSITANVILNHCENYYSIVDIISYLITLKKELLLSSELQSIYIAKQPLTTKYAEGQNFDNTGMVVNAKYYNKYNDGTSAYVIKSVPYISNSYSWEIGYEYIKQSLTGKDTYITISYTDGVTRTVNQPITVEAKVTPKPSVTPTATPKPTATPIPTKIEIKPTLTTTIIDISGNKTTPTPVITSVPSITYALDDETVQNAIKKEFTDKELLQLYEAICDYTGEIDEYILGELANPGLIYEDIDEWYEIFDDGILSYSDVDLLYRFYWTILGLYGYNPPTPLKSLKSTSTPTQKPNNTLQRLLEDVDWSDLYDDEDVEEWDIDDWYDYLEDDYNEEEIDLLYDYYWSLKSKKPTSIPKPTATPTPSPTPIPTQSKVDKKGHIIVEKEGIYPDDIYFTLDGYKITLGKTTLGDIVKNTDFDVYEYLFTYCNNQYVGESNEHKGEIGKKIDINKYKFNFDSIDYYAEKNRGKTFVQTNRVIVKDKNKNQYLVTINNSKDIKPSECTITFITNLFLLGEAYEDYGDWYEGDYYKSELSDFYVSETYRMSANKDNYFTLLDIKLTGNKDKDLQKIKDKFVDDNNNIRIIDDVVFIKLRDDYVQHPYEPEQYDEKTQSWKNHYSWNVYKKNTFTSTYPFKSTTSDKKYRFLCIDYRNDYIGISQINNDSSLMSNKEIKAERKRYKEYVKAVKQSVKEQDKRNEASTLNFYYNVYGKEFVDFFNQIKKRNKRL